MASIVTVTTITSTEACNKNMYPSYGANWKFTGVGFPEIVPNPAKEYSTDITPVNYKEIDDYNALRMGVVRENGSFDYSGLLSKWDLSESLPSLVQTPSPEYNTGFEPIDYSPWIEVEKLTMGTSINKDKSKDKSLYQSGGYTIGDKWDYAPETGLMTPRLVTPIYDVSIKPIDYTSIDTYNKIRSGSGISMTESVDIAPYSNAKFNFSNVWGMQLGLEHPTLLNHKKHTPISDPMSSTSWEVLMEIDRLGIGNMYYDGFIWNPAHSPKPIEVKGGMTGDPISHALSKELTRTTLEDGSEEYYIYLGAGLENPAKPSGYDEPKKVLGADTVIHETLSSDVAFYYTKVEAPDYYWLLKVSSGNPEAPYHLVVTNDRADAIKLRLPNKQYGWVKLVPLDDPFSSPVKVRTPSGIYALQSPDVNESLFTSRPINVRPCVAFITRETIVPENRELINALDKLGYNVTLISDSTASSKLLGTFDKYDVIVIGRTTSDAYAGAIDYSKKPVIMGYAVEKAINLQNSLGFTSSEPYHTEAIVPTSQIIMNNTHLITKNYRVGQVLSPYKSKLDNFVGVTDGRNNSTFGQPLIRSNNHPLGMSAVSMSARTMPDGNRRVYMGFLYREFSQDTLELLGRALKWVTFRDDEL